MHETSIWVYNVCLIETIFGDLQYDWSIINWIENKNIPKCSIHTVFFPFYSVYFSLNPEFLLKSDSRYWKKKTKYLHNIKWAAAVVENEFWNFCDWWVGLEISNSHLCFLYLLDVWIVYFLCEYRNVDSVFRLKFIISFVNMKIHRNKFKYHQKNSNKCEKCIISS